MSRIGKLPIAIPAGVTVDIKDGVITVKGKLGELSQKFGDAVSIEVEDGQLHVKPNEATTAGKPGAMHGLYRALIHNMVKVRGMKLAAAREALAKNRQRESGTTELMNRLLDIREQLVSLRKELDEIV